MLFVHGIVQYSATESSGHENRGDHKSRPY
jgi:hypothetical protein